jgi:hypothetical protein
MCLRLAFFRRAHRRRLKLLARDRRLHRQATGPVDGGLDALAATPGAHCGHIGATTASLPRVLICSQCEHGAFFKSGRQTGDVAEHHTRRKGGPSRGVGAV